MFTMMLDSAADPDAWQRAFAYLDAPVVVDNVNELPKEQQKALIRAGMARARAARGQGR